MKKLLLACVLSSVCIGAHANTGDYNDDFCRKMLIMAEGIINARQSGVPLSQSLSINDANISKKDNRNLSELMQNIIIDAYKEPLMYSDEMKRRSTYEFGANYYLACHEASKQQ